MHQGSATWYRQRKWLESARPNPVVYPGSRGRLGREQWFLLCAAVIAYWFMTLTFEAPTLTTPPLKII